MNNCEIVKHLRNRQPIKTYGFASGGQRVFTHYQINLAVKNICWQRFISKDRHNWIEINSYLSLKDVLQCIENNKKLNR